MVAAAALRAVPNTVCERFEYRRFPRSVFPDEKRDRRREAQLESRREDRQLERMRAFDAIPFIDCHAGQKRAARRYARGAARVLGWHGPADVACGRLRRIR